MILRRLRFARQPSIASAEPKSHVAEGIGTASTPREILLIMIVGETISGK
jgi:hypothetical protein